MGKPNPKPKGKKKDNALSVSHPNSRKALRLIKQSFKEAARQKTKAEYGAKRMLFAERLKWFKDNLQSEGPLLSPKEFSLLIEKYLARFKEELEQIDIKHSVGQRKNRQHASRESTIKMTLEQENEEFNNCGFEMVDILHPKQLKIFKEWDYEIGKINNFKIKRFSKTFLENYKPPPEHLKKPVNDNAEKSDMDLE